MRKAYFHSALTSLSIRRSNEHDESYIYSPEKYVTGVVFFLIIFIRDYRQADQKEQQRIQLYMYRIQRLCNSALLSKRFMERKIQQNRLRMC